MTRFFAAGNAAIPEDSLAIRLAERIEEPDFEPLLDPLQLLQIDEPVVILDVAKGIKETQWIHASENNKLQRQRSMMSLHDFDLQFVLNMGRALGELPDIWLLAVPMEDSLEDTLPLVQKALKSIPSPLQGSGTRS